MKKEWIKPLIKDLPIFGDPTVGDDGLGTGLIS